MRSRRVNEKDKLRAAVLAYDCFNEVMHGGRLGTYLLYYSCYESRTQRICNNTLCIRFIGNKRAMEMQVQLSKALKKVDNIVQEYNNNNPTSRKVFT